jgi:hypothetical protein
MRNRNASDTSTKGAGECFTSETQMAREQELCYRTGSVAHSTAAQAEVKNEAPKCPQNPEFDFGTGRGN